MATYKIVGNLHMKKKKLTETKDKGHSVVIVKKRPNTYIGELGLLI